MAAAVLEEGRVRESEPAAIRAAAQGDRRAFEELVRVHQAPVYRFLRRMLGDAALAEDVTQETFLRLYTRLGSYNFQSKFTTWLFQVARNAGIDALRSRERQSRLAAASVDAPGSSAPMAPPDVRVELQAAIDSLPENLRTPLLLVEVLGMRYREAAEVMKVPEGTVKSRVFHARTQLHKWAMAGSSEGAGEVSSDEA